LPKCDIGLEISIIFSNFVIRFNIILERQVELLILNQLAEGISPADLKKGQVWVDNKLYDLEAMGARNQELLDEFLQPYVIDNAPKGD
jgi:hypothetical protein